MAKYRNRLYQIVLFIGDTGLFFLALFLAYVVRRNDVSPELDVLSTLFFAFSPIWLFVVASYFIANLYEVPSLITTISRIKTVMRLNVVALIYGLSIFYAFSGVFGVTPKLILLFQVAMFTFFVSIWRVYAAHHIQSTKKRHALLVGQGSLFKELKNEVNHNPQSPVIFIDHIELHSPLLHGEGMESLRTMLKENEISLLVVDVKHEKVVPLLPQFYNLTHEGIRIYDIHKMYEDVFKRTPLTAVGYFWFFENVTLDMRIYEIVKRFLDLLLTIPAGLLLLLSMPFVFIANKIEGAGDGTLFSKQKRLGKGGKLIEVYKYRTMLFTDNGNWRSDGGNKNYDTKVGSFLRRTNIDELPQIINIIKGEMSFIGPRNDVVALGEKLHKEIPYYAIRYSIKPGISGWAQTLQHSKNINPQSVEETMTRFQYDLYYIKNRSLVLDMVVILRTIRILLIRLGL